VLVTGKTGKKGERFPEEEREIRVAKSDEISLHQFGGSGREKKERSLIIKMKCHH